MKKLLTFLLAIFILSSYSCKKPLGFQYRDVKNFHLENFGLKKSRVSMDFVFFNPNGFPVNLKKIDCDVFVDSSYIGKFLLDTTIHISRTSEFTLPVNMDVEMKNIMKTSFNALINSEVLLGARGTTRVGRSGLYVTIPFRYEGKQKLNLF